MNKYIVIIGFILAIVWFVSHGIFILDNQHTNIVLEGNKEQQAYTTTLNSLGGVSNWFWIPDFLVAGVLFIGLFFIVFNKPIKEN